MLEKKIVRAVACVSLLAVSLVPAARAQSRNQFDALGGHGLWLVYQVCDLVELRSDEIGTTIRMHMAIQPPPAGE